MRNLICDHCGGVAMLGNITKEDNQWEEEKWGLLFQKCSFTIGMKRFK